MPPGALRDAEVSDIGPVAAALVKVAAAIEAVASTTATTTPRIRSLGARTANGPDQGDAPELREQHEADEQRGDDDGGEAHRAAAQRVDRVAGVGDHDREVPGGRALQL